MTEFKNRVYGCAVVKAINSNYNADFSGQPRTLPNGTVYATDKAFKYTIKNYLKDVYTNDVKILGLKRYNPTKEFVPFSLIEAFAHMFPNLIEIDNKKTKKSNNKSTDESDKSPKDTSETAKIKGTKKDIAKALLSCYDTRVFGLTFAAKAKKKEDNVAISVHGPLQVSYGVNLWESGYIYTDQIMSPYRNPDDKSEDKQATTLGSQSRLDEGHYLHHFSINPHNLCDIAELVGEGAQVLSTDDISKLKEAMRRGVTWYDSASKAGTENEMLVWIQLDEKSRIVLPNFSTLIELKQKKQDGKCVYDFSKLTEELNKVSSEIETIEVYYNKQTVVLENLPEELTSEINETGETKTITITRNDI